MKIELVAGQMWRVGTGFIRVVKVGRLLVEYKVMQDLDHKVAPLSLVSQKEFCAMLKTKKAALEPVAAPVASSKAGGAKAASKTPAASAPRKPAPAKTAPVKKTKAAPTARAVKPASKSRAKAK